jgi:hypothetical protein
MSLEHAGVWSSLGTHNLTRIQVPSPLLTSANDLRLPISVPKWLGRSMTGRNRKKLITMGMAVPIGRRDTWALVTAMWSGGPELGGE